MSKLPDELRNWSEGDAYLAPRKTKRMLDEAADRIEQLEAELGTAKEGLEFLDALIRAGVDNWSGYDYALDILEGGR